MRDNVIAPGIQYIGADDKELDLFEGQYAIPEGISYNSYLIIDEKVAILDTIDARKTIDWMENLKGALKDRKPDYLIVSHTPLPYFSAISTTLPMDLASMTPPGMRMREAVSPRTLE